MRLGEIKNTIDNTLTEDKVLFIDYESIFGNQAYIIKNYRLLMNIIEILHNQKRNDADIELINGIIDEFGIDNDSIQISADQFNQLNQYISTINTKMPLYYSILETMVSKQNETMINIKLPNMKIESLSDLNDFNQRIDKILKSFSINYQFKGLDKGSERYEILINGVEAYNIFIACLDIAQKCISIYKDYRESTNPEKDYKASLEKPDMFTEKGLKKYIQRRLDIELEAKIQELLLLSKVDNGKKPIELQTQFIIATKSLIEELGQGTEFHLSLNPPEYAKELGGSLVIDYKKMAFLSDTSNKMAITDKKLDKIEE